MTPTTARFASLAELRRHPLFARFAPFVRHDEDIEESVSTAAVEEEEADDVPLDRPPSDLVVSRLDLAVEAYALSYEENCGEGLEDRRDLHHVVVARGPSGLVEVMRFPLCGPGERGFALTAVDLDGDRVKELVVRSWIAEPEEAPAHRLRVFRASRRGLELAGDASDEVPGAAGFAMALRRDGPTRVVEVTARRAADGGAEPVRRYRLERQGLVPLPGR